MALFNYAARELTLKVVYCGPGLSGKTTNIQHLHRAIQPEKRGKLLSLATETDRTLFFDFLPVNLGKINDFDIRFQLYTVPGQVRYNATRRLVLKGADAIVFVADSQREMKQDNRESFDGMLENMRENGLDPVRIPIVLQYNKRDLDNIMPPEELDVDLNRAGYPVFHAVAINGRGVDATFKGVVKILLDGLAGKQNLQTGKIEGETAKKRTEENAGGHEQVLPVMEEATVLPVIENTAGRFGQPQDMVVYAGRNDGATPRHAMPPPEKEAAGPDPLQEDIKTALESVRNALEGVRNALEGVCNGLEDVQNAVDGVRNTQEDVCNALSGLASKMDALGSELKARPAPAASDAPAAGKDAEKGLEELKEIVLALKAEISSLVSVRTTLESERDERKNKKDGEQAAARMDGIFSLARETKLMEEESLYLLRILESRIPDARISDAPPKKKGLFSRLFSR